jgi:hypothetical protein
MALNVNRGAIRASVRQAADIENATARHSDSELNDFINRGIAALYYLINESRGGQYYVTTATVPTVAGTASYALASDFYKLLSVTATINGRQCPLLPVDDEAQRVLLSDTSYGWRGEPARYELAGGNIVFYPTPQAVYSIAVRYVPAAPQPAADGTNLDTIERFDDYVIYYAAREAATKDEEWELVTALTTRLLEVEARVRASAPMRDQGAPPRVQDTREAELLGRRRWP